MNQIFAENRPPLRWVFPLTTIAAVCFAFLPFARAVTPAPDGGYGGDNTAEGTNALFSLTTGVWNTATGFEALKGNTTGSTNTATGFRALAGNLDGSANTAVGSQALLNAGGTGNIALGAQAGINLTTESGDIDLGNPGTAGDNNVIRIGRGNVQKKTFIAGISGVPVVGATVVVTSSGQLGIGSTSSARFKDEIKPMDKASEAILALKPVTFRYRKEVDPQGVPQFGLVAEDVVKVNPALVTRGPDGKLETVRYDAVNAMLLNEFLKEHRKVEELESALAQVTIQLKEQASQIHKVSAQLEMSKPAPQLVVNH